MLSQLKKTIKLALKSTEEEREVLRARSVVQRFPVIEWRQQVEDFHRRSITSSRSLAADSAWDPRALGAHQAFAPQGESPSLHTVIEDHPDGESTYFRRHSHFGDDDTASVSTSFVSGNAPSLQTPQDTEQSYDRFLLAANKQFARTNTAGDDASFTPSRPFSIHSRASSFDSISSIMDVKSESSLNKAIETFTDADGEVAQTFVDKLGDLSASNSTGDLCIEKYLMKSEKRFFKDIKKEKMATGE